MLTLGVNGPLPCFVDNDVVRMDSRPILPAKILVTIDTVFNFDRHKHFGIDFKLACHDKLLDLFPLLQNFSCEVNITHVSVFVVTCWPQAVRINVFVFTI